MYHPSESTFVHNFRTRFLTVKIDIFTYHLIKKLGSSDLQWGDRIPVYCGRRITAICTRALVDRPVAPLRHLLARVFTDTVYNSFLLDVSQMRSVTSSMDSTRERSLRQVSGHFSLPRDVTQQINLCDVQFGGTTSKASCGAVSVLSH